MAKTGKPVNKALYAKAKAKVKARVAKSGLVHMQAASLFKSTSAWVVSTQA